MKTFIGILAFLTVAAQVSASDEILSILNTAKDLTLQELNLLRPLFNELQKQYDYITHALETEGQNDIVPWQKEIWPQSTNLDHLDELDSMLVPPKDLPTIEYDTKLPTLEEIMGDIDIYSADFTKEQIAELEDMQEILRETLEESQSKINDLVRRALLIESQLFKLNKPKIVTYIYTALSVVFRYSERLRRAVYCVYAHAPELNESMNNINAGVDCYKYTSRLVLRVQTQTVHTVATIKRNVLDLAKIYKKIAAKNSIFGKIITALLNLLRITRDVRESYDVAMKALDDLENELPGGLGNTIQCGTNFAESLPQVLETAVNVTTCVTFIDDTVIDYDDLLLAPDRDFDFGNFD